MKVKSESEVAQSCLTLHDPMDCSLPGSSVHGILQARVLEWGAIAFSMTRLLQCSLLPSLAAFIYFHKHFFLYFLFEKDYFFFLLTSESLLYILDISLYQVHDLQIFSPISYVASHFFQFIYSDSRPSSP